MKRPPVPAATYRLQFKSGFTYADAAALTPYLQALGISHVYASPLLRARPGSEHGYDVVDHNSFNPEIGDYDAFNAYVAGLHQQGMGLLLDTVPNHMDVGSGDNDWWQDLLENGEASPYAGFFDVDWHPVKRNLRDKVLLPVLGDHYGNVLDRGELRLELDEESGTLYVRYYEHRYPLDPRTYGGLIERTLPGAQRSLGATSDTATALAVLGEAFGALPPHHQPEGRARHEAAAACKRQLAALCGRDEAARRLLRDAVAEFNRAGDGAAGAPLHPLLEAQPYRLAYWRVAADEINYRRFFDINELACIRMENPDVFDATHRLVRQLVEAGAVDGLRIDHVDGLSDPRGYCEKLHGMLAVDTPASAAASRSPPYLVVEKILASHEDMPRDWPVAGTTGYEVGHWLNGLFVEPRAEAALGRVYRRFTQRRQDFAEVVYQCKKLLIFHDLSSELTVLANLLNEIAQSDIHTRDFTYHGLREALAELVARFPVYRTYITAEAVGEQDRRYVRWAIGESKRHSQAADTQVFDFIAGLLLGETPGAVPGHGDPRVDRFVARFQQYTAPVTAKALEDTACYVYNRLASLNEVGASPASFGVSAEAFHAAVGQRMAEWPDAMISTSTHDTKRSEDVRVRIDVLTEIPEEWRRHLARWSRINRMRRAEVNGQPAPSRNDEYLLYQTLLGVWPLHEEELDDFEQRIQGYMLKAVREAKLHTSWINPDSDYEDAVQGFVAALLHDRERNAFLAGFLPFQRRVAHLGLLNGLSQTLLKLGLPGVPDIFQGNEVWTLSLVDPDNRRAVDFASRAALLEALQARCRGRSEHTALLREMLETLPDGRAKLYLTWRALELRRDRQAFFRAAAYDGLRIEGPRAGNAVAFARSDEDGSILYAATRFYAGLWPEADVAPDPAIWSDTWIALPGEAHGRHYRDHLSGQVLVESDFDGRAGLAAAAVFAHWPVALLVEEPA